MTPRRRYNNLKSQQNHHGGECPSLQPQWIPSSAPTPCAPRGPRAHPGRREGADCLDDGQPRARGDGRAHTASATDTITHRRREGRRGDSLRVPLRPRGQQPPARAAVGAALLPRGGTVGRAASSAATPPTAGCSQCGLQNKRERNHARSLPPPARSPAHDSGYTARVQRQPGSSRAPLGTPPHPRRSRAKAPCGAGHPEGRGKPREWRARGVRSSTERRTTAAPGAGRGKELIVSGGFPGFTYKHAHGTQPSSQVPPNPSASCGDYKRAGADGGDAHLGVPLAAAPSRIGGGGRGQGRGREGGGSREPTPAASSARPGSGGGSGSRARTPSQEGREGGREGRERGREGQVGRRRE